MSEFEYHLRQKLAAGNLLNKVDLDAILEGLRTQLKEPDLTKLKHLGAGFNAEVFWMTDKKKVVKISRDLEDAKASLVVKKKPSKYLVKTYDVFALTPDRYSVYCIVNEKLTPLGREEERFIDALKEINQTLHIDYMTMQNWEKIEEKILTPHGIDWLENYKNVPVKDFTNFYKNMAEALDSRGIRWGDIKTVNFMMRGHQIVISDLGAGIVSGAPRIPIM